MLSYLLNEVKVAVNKNLKVILALAVFSTILSLILFFSKNFLEPAPAIDNKPFFYESIGVATNKDSKIIANVQEKFTLHIATTKSTREAAEIIDKANFTEDCFFTARKENSDTDIFYIQCGIFEDQEVAEEKLKLLKKQNLKLLSDAKIMLLD